MYPRRCLSITMTLHSKPPFCKNHCELFSFPRSKKNCPIINTFKSLIPFDNYQYNCYNIEARFSKTCLSIISKFKNVLAKIAGIFLLSNRQRIFVKFERRKKRRERAARQSISRNDETEASSIVARGSRTQTVLLTTMRGRDGGRVETKQIIVRPIGA